MTAHLALASVVLGAASVAAVRHVDRLATCREFQITAGVAALAAGLSACLAVLAVAYRPVTR